MGLLTGGVGIVGILVGIALAFLWIWLLDVFGWDIWPHNNKYCESVKPSTDDGSTE